MKYTRRKFHSFYFSSNFIKLIEYRMSWAKNITRPRKSVVAFKVKIRALSGAITTF